jgi:hypothetical protein
MASKEDDVDIKVSDFGLSKVVGEDQLMKTLCGTPQYLVRMMGACDLLINWWPTRRLRSLRSGRATLQATRRRSTSGPWVSSYIFCKFPCGGHTHAAQTLRISSI